MKKILYVLQTDNFKRAFYWALLLLTSIFIVSFFSLQIEKSSFLTFNIVTDHNITGLTFMVFGVCWLLNKTSDWVLSSQNGAFQTMLQFLLSSFFTFVSISGAYFDSAAQIPFISFLKNPFSLMYFMFALCGGLLFFFFIIRLIWNLDAFSSKTICSKENWLEIFLGRHLYRNCILVLILSWLPQYIIRFPGVMSYDNWQSLAMYFGTTQTTTQHPLIWNVILGKLTELGTLIGVGWLAPFVICLVHHILAVFLVSYAVSTVKKIGLGSKFSLCTLVFFAILPPMYLLASTAYNDFIYCLAFLLLTIELMHYLYEREIYFSSFKHIGLTALAVFSTIFRYNGIYSMLPLLFVLFLRELHLFIKKRTRAFHSAILLMIFVFSLLAGQIIQRSLNHMYDAKPITSRAILAMPIQQSVRCLKNHGDKIPKKTYDDLHTVLTWSDEEYKENYNPRNFDGVKESFKTDATKEEVVSFIKAWLSLVKMYPADCIAASINQNYYLFSPLVDNARYYSGITLHSELAYQKYGLDPSPYVFESHILETLCVYYGIFQSNTFPSIPILGLTVNQAVYTLLLLVISLCLLFKKDKRTLILAIPLLITLGITFIGPATFNHPRYTYPIMFCMPLLIASFLISNPTKKRSMEEK